MKTLGRVSLGLLVLAFIAASAVGAEEPKRVLMVHSFGSTAPPFTTHSTAFETALTEAMGRRVDLDEVSLDMARYAQADMEEPFVELMLKRLAKWTPDLVVPIGSPAGRFVARNRDRLFPQTPVIYTGMDKRTLPPDAFRDNATFVGEDFDLAGLVEDILQLKPDTNNIVVVLGATPLERYWTAHFQKAFEPFTNRVNFTWTNDLSFDELLDRAGKLPPRSFIVLGLLIRDALGVTHNEDEALQRLHAVANAPINGLYQNQLGLGIVGGRLYQAELEGVESARIAVRILRGEPVANFPPLVIGTQPRPRYDWRELQRWNISESRLPPGSVIAFRQPTVWEQYRWWFLGALFVALLEGGLLVQLGVNLAKRRRVERALRESESRFRIVADSAPVLIWMSGVDKLCTFFSKPWLDFTGRTAEQEMGSGWTEGVHPDDRHGCLEAYAKAFDARQPFVLQYRLRRHDGEYRWISDHGVPRYDEQGNFAGYAGSCSDITERLRAEDRFRQVVEAAPNAMIMVNADGTIALVNGQAETVFGYQRGELIGLPIETLIPERFRHEHPGHRRHFARNPQTRSMGVGQDLFGRRKDGSEVAVEIGLNPIRTMDGLVVVASVIDITERRKAEAEAQGLRQELTHMSRVAIMGELTAAIVHELGQPLTAILANARAGLRIIAANHDAKEVRDILEDIVDDDHRASQVIQHLRSLFKKGEVEHRPLQFNTVINDVVSVVHADAGRRNVAIALDLAARLPLVSGDRVQLQQVLLNLVVNAFDAVADVTDRPRKVILHTRTLGEKYVQVDVADTGPGIAPEKLDSIFQPFVTTRPGGMGMGLSVSHSIVSAHAGRLWAENGPDGGAIFHLVLPAILDEAGFS